MSLIIWSFQNRTTLYPMDSKYALLWRSYSVCSSCWLPSNSMASLFFTETKPITYFPMACCLLNFTQFNFSPFKTSQSLRSAGVGSLPADGRVGNFLGWLVLVALNYFTFHVQLGCFSTLTLLTSSKAPPPNPSFRIWGRTGRGYFKFLITPNARSFHPSHLQSPPPAPSTGYESGPTWPTAFACGPRCARPPAGR